MESTRKDAIFFPLPRDPLPILAAGEAVTSAYTDLQLKENNVRAKRFDER